MSRDARPPNARVVEAGPQPRKLRADQLLVERGYARTRSRAQALLMSGQVFVAEQRIDKAGTRLPVDAPLVVRETDRFVSRGGYKLEGALAQLRVTVAGRVAADIGASTGGFTDCLLQHGARKVFAIDVGSSQLHERLARDPRVVVRDRTNARFLTATSLGEAMDLVVVDASFIGLGKLLPALRALLRNGGELLGLIKPQFEVGREEARRARGVIREEAVRARAVQNALAEIEAAGFVLLGECPSSLPGPKGNLEHFAWARAR